MAQPVYPVPRLVKDSPASFAGLIFAEKSKRFVTLEQAKQITYAVPFHYVGVFVDAPIELVVNYAQELWTLVGCAVARSMSTKLTSTR